MTHTTHSARITGPIPYVSAAGRRARIPVGPCLLDDTEGDAVDIVWGASGERSTALSRGAVQAAEADGRLVLLD